MVDFTSKLADQISGKVRVLDLAKNRVFEAIQRVDDVLDLKFCSDGVEKSMKEKDLEDSVLGKGISTFWRKIKVPHG